MDNTEAKENFIELITNNGYKLITDSGGVFTLWSNDERNTDSESIWIGEERYLVNTPVLFTKHVKFISFDEAKEYFIEHYVGIRKVVNNNE